MFSFFPLSLKRWKKMDYGSLNNQEENEDIL